MQVPQFQDGSISGWNMTLNVCSLNGTQYPAKPVADHPRFEFATMPSGKPGLKLHPGKYLMLANGPTSPEHNETNKYWIDKTVYSKGGEVTLSVLCQSQNNGFMTIYLKTDKFDEIGCGNKVATGYGTAWMPLRFMIPTGRCVISLFFSGDAMQTGADMSIDRFFIPE
jgi:hypothetical protein